MMEHTLLKDRPVIIDGPGLYRARSGKKVVIDEIGDSKKSTFNCKGSWYRGPHRGWQYDIWHPNGSHTAFYGSPLDIIGRLKDS